MWKLNQSLSINWSLPINSWFKRPVVPNYCAKKYLTHSIVRILSGWLLSCNSQLYCSGQYRRTCPEILSFGCENSIPFSSPAGPDQRFFEFEHSIPVRILSYCTIAFDIVHRSHLMSDVRPFWFDEHSFNAHFLYCLEQYLSCFILSCGLVVKLCFRSGHLAICVRNPMLLSVF